MALILEYTEPGNGTANGGQALFLESVYTFSDETHYCNVYFSLCNHTTNTVQWISPWQRSF